MLSWTDGFRQEFTETHKNKKQTSYYPLVFLKVVLTGDICDLLAISQFLQEFSNRTMAQKIHNLHNINT